MEFVKLLNAGRFHSSIYHRILNAIVSFLQTKCKKFARWLIILLCCNAFSIVLCRFILQLMLICSWIYLTQSTSSTSMSGMLLLITHPLVNMCSFFWFSMLLFCSFGNWLWIWFYATAILHTSAWKSLWKLWKPQLFLVRFFFFFPSWLLFVFV